MAQETITKLIILKEIVGYTNRKIVQLASTIKNLDKLYLKLKEENLIIKKDENFANKIIEECNVSEILIVSYFDEIYPNKLKQISTKPVLLFCKGDIELLNKPSVSIVGTRKASENALNWTYNASKELASKGYVIVSGGAKGIDRSAHEGALEANGDTICVIGGGFKNLYPKENIDLIEIIMKNGLIISEHPPNKFINRFSLLERNRITSGLSDKVFIISTESSGGTMSQYKIAKSQKKEVFCPSPDLKLEPLSGILDLIQENKIKVISNVNDLFLNNQRTLLL